MRFKPNPPALVDMRNSCNLEFGFVNSSIYCSLSSSGVLPSNLQYSIPRRTQKSSRMLRTEVNYEKSKVCSFFYNIFFINWSTSTNFPDAYTICSPYVSDPGGSIPSKR